MESGRPLQSNPVIEDYKRHVDRTLIRENLRLSVTERFEKLMALQKFAEELRRRAMTPGGGNDRLSGCELGADSLAQVAQLAEALLPSRGELLHVLGTALGEVQNYGFGRYILGGHLRHFAGD
jgi:hypothetical protein